MRDSTGDTDRACIVKATSTTDDVVSHWCARVRVCVCARGKAKESEQAAAQQSITYPMSRHKKRKLIVVSSSRTRHVVPASEHESTCTACTRGVRAAPMTASPRVHAAGTRARRHDAADRRRVDTADRRNSERRASHSLPR